MKTSKKIMSGIMLILFFSSVTLAQTTVKLPTSGTMGGDYCTFIGIDAAYSNTSSGDYNSFIGYRSGYSNTSGDYNSFLGTYSGYKNTTGIYSTLLGHRSGYYLTTGTRNTFVGAYSGYYNDGTKNVFLGCYAGYNETGSEKLYIDNSSTSSPLIYGDFSTNIVKINGSLYTYNKIYSGSSTNLVAMGYDGAHPYIESTGTNNKLLFNYYNGNDIHMCTGSNKGNVTMGENLYVKGKIWTTEITVDLTNPYADYVFSEDYRLSSISDVEKFIEENHHLPDVPSEAEVNESGINLGEMDVILLRKIEELTLYVIEQNKKLEEQESLISKMREELNSLTAE